MDTRRGYSCLETRSEFFSLRNFDVRWRSVFPFAHAICALISWMRNYAERGGLLATATLVRSFPTRVMVLRPAYHCLFPISICGSFFFCRLFAHGSPGRFLKMLLGPINVRATGKDVRLKVKEEYNNYRVNILLPYLNFSSYFPKLQGLILFYSFLWEHLVQLSHC